MQCLLDKEGTVQCRHSRENGKLVPLVNILLWNNLSSVNVSVSICVAKPSNAQGTKMSIKRLKAGSVEFGLRTGSGRLFQADGPAIAKARLPYMLSWWCGVCSRFRSAEPRCLNACMRASLGILVKMKGNNCVIGLYPLFPTAVKLCKFRTTPYYDRFLLLHV